MDFYIQVLTTRQRSLKARIADVGRWDESFDTLQQELETVEHELAAMADQEARRSSPQAQQSPDLTSG